jgi:sugar transferase (PEP-CTERM/EpsH1 system associated)
LAEAGLRSGDVRDDRPHLLFLCHRFPYPPDKGDKIRAYHWWLALVQHFQVHLGAFIDDPADWRHEQALRERCASTLLLPLMRGRAKLRSLGGLFTGSALTFPYYRDARMQRWAEECRVAFGIGYVLVFSAAMAQYVEGGRWSRVRRVIDFVDVDSDKWCQYAQGRSWSGGWVYRRESERLAAAEVRLAQVFDASLLVSDHEAQLFRGRVGKVAGRVAAISNGVDSSYFDVAAGRSSPFPAASEPVVFTGAMDYWANVDAVTWFAREIWPRVRQQRPRAAFWIVGSRPTPEVEALRGNGIEVTGRVADVRPYLQHAAVVVAPMRIARGIQNKVLEGMAMGKPVVLTGRALEGIGAVPGRDLLVADEPGDYADALLGLLRGRGATFGAAARRLVEEHYQWAVSARQLIAAVRGTGGRRSDDAQ